MIEKTLDFSKYSSIKIGSIGLLKIAQSVNEALELDSMGGIIIGKMNNILLGNTKKEIFQLGSEFDYIRHTNDYLEIGARVNNRKAFLYTKKNNIGGLEFLSALPGCIGGAIAMNAGMKSYEIKDSILEVLVNDKWINIESLNFEYRKSNINGLIFAAKFKVGKVFDNNLESLFKEMRSNQPKDPSCGSCFKNPSTISAGEMLECVGLRGFSIGGMGFSAKHANFLVNLGNGTFEDSIKLINLAKQRVFERFNIKLQNEIIIIN